jgi:hypothetical protein
VSDRLGFYIWPALAILTGCATMAKADAIILGTPPEPLEPGRYFVITDTRAKTLAHCARLIGFPTTACTYRRAGDGTSTIVISIDDMGRVHKHEAYHAAQGDRGEPMDHRGWK